MQLHAIRVSTTGGAVSYTAVLDACSGLQPIKLRARTEPELGKLKSHQARNRPL